jgi:hypothetical protein
VPAPIVVLTVLFVKLTTLTLLVEPAVTINRSALVKNAATPVPPPTPVIVDTTVLVTILITLTVPLNPVTYTRLLPETLSATLVALTPTSIAATTLFVVMSITHNLPALSGLLVEATT